MTRIPPVPLALGLAGLIPFAWGAVTTHVPPLAAWSAVHLGPRLTGPYVQLFYGAVILAFMSGVLWGFAAKARQNAALGYVLSVLPALWAFFMTGGGPEASGRNLIFGFAGLLVLDYAFGRWGLAPPWWMRLRVILTAVAVLCLATGVYL